MLSPLGRFSSTCYLLPRIPSNPLTSIAQVIDPQGFVAVTSCLSRRMFEQLFLNPNSAGVVEGFFTANACKAIIQKKTEQSSNPLKIMEAIPSEHSIRQQNPASLADALYKELAKTWKGPLEIETQRISGRQYVFACNNAFIQCYDTVSLGERIPYMPALMFNIYVKTPEDSMRLWNVSFKQKLAGLSQKATLPSPDVEIYPQAGDAIVFNPRVPYTLPKGAEDSIIALSMGLFAKNTLVVSSPFHPTRV